MKSRTTGAGQFIGIVLAIGISSAALATESNKIFQASRYLNNATFCSDMQIDLSGAMVDALSISNDIYNTNVAGDDAAFRSAKVETVPLTVRQLNVYDASGLKQIMCKTKSREGLLAQTGDIFAGKENDCRDVTKTLLQRAFTSLSPANKDIAAQNLGNTVIDATSYDQFGGLVWANPGAYNTITVDADGIIHLRSEGLFTANDPNTPISDAFVDLLNVVLQPYGITLPYGTTYGELIALGFVNPKELGTHYCTVPSPEAIQRALLQ